MMENYIEDKKNLYRSILKFLEGSDEHNDDESMNESLQELINIIKNQQIKSDVPEMLQFLEIVKSIGEHHHRDQQINKRINQLLIHYKVQIKQTLSNSDIFHIFENNKKIVLFLIKNDIITISEEIYEEIFNKIENNGNRYCHFFIPELENFSSEKIKFIKNEILKEDPDFFTNYESNREIGENDSYICSLIRQDSVEEFIIYVNSRNISASSEILPSIFETNPFLIDNKKTTLIEYSAFFGSIQIFRYLLMNKAELTSSLWLYAIHSKNAELIHLLESNEIAPPKFKNEGKEEEENRNAPSSNNYEQCLIESIKCHHNGIADYIENNFTDQLEKDSQQNEEIISNCIKYHNYSHFQVDLIIDYGFFYLHFYHYDELFELLLNKKKELIDEKKIQYESVPTAANNNEVEVIYALLLQTKKISYIFFSGTIIKQIAIPSSVTSIGTSTFSKCSSLTQISIPSSVTSIGEYAFSGCSSLTQIIIPSSVTSIGEGAFSDCSSLKQITIPSSVTSIGNSSFTYCSSLTQITIPSSVTSIKKFTFRKCSSLTQISIPSSVTSIEKHAFSICSSLIQITVPSSVTSIGEYAFSECILLTQITIPSSVTSIGEYAFSECSSLTEISIPSSVTSIGKYTFFGCSSLTQITIPSSVTSIGEYAFSECSSLTQITIPSSVTSIGRYTFYGCSSLAQIKGKPI